MQLICIIHRDVVNYTIVSRISFDRSLLRSQIKIKSHLQICISWGSADGQTQVLRMRSANYLNTLTDQVIDNVRMYRAQEESVSGP